MKQLFTLLLCTGFASGAFAQSDRDRAADVILRGGGNPSTQTTSTSGGGYRCQNQLDAINRNYDAQVVAMRNNGAYTPAERDLQVRRINEARRSELARVRRECGGTNTNTGYNNGQRKNKVKGNNGNHYGWEKGKGNPHRNGGKAKGKKDD